MVGPPLLDCEDSAWFRDQPEAARGAAAALGRRIGLGEHRTAQLVLAVAELSTNVAKHAADSSMLLRVLRNRTTAGVEVLVLDSGPGMVDVPAALRDGVSSVGTLGIGLGAVQRLADAFDVHSLPGVGTVQLARFWPHPLDPSLAAEAVVSGVTRPMGGEDVCGDAWAARVDTGGRTTSAPGEGGAPAAGTRIVPAWSKHPRAGTSGEGDHRAAPPPRRSPEPDPGGRSRLLRGAAPGAGDGVLVMSCDGLGHGPMAAIASQSAVHAFRSGTARTPEQAMEEVHRALRGTRGAAVAIARLETDGRVLFCGIGNISACVLTTGSRANLLSHPGIVGHQMRQLRTYEARLPAHGALVMHSDGLSERWKAGDLATLLHHPPAVIAAGLLRLAGTRRDDASVVAFKGAW
ncbi:ATP-binding protein [Streptomyces sp. NPDC059917]|uniref:ATP-binding protein n=1 Tax=Streptomyces sp. NPDC059917 TaxID=3347002 RepID=UPI0036491580